MPAPEDGNRRIAEGSELESGLHSRDTPERCQTANIDHPAIVDLHHEESTREILERIIEQDRELGEEVDLIQHLESASEDTDQPAAELIDKKRLNEILEHARRENIPDKLFGYLCELESDFPEEIEVPFVRRHALSDVMRPMWEYRIEHELKVDLLQDLEDPDSVEKLFVPQPQSEIDNPQNLYQLVRKAWDHNRMEELLGMIEENDDAMLGETGAEARVRFDRELEEYLRRPKEKSARESQETP